MKYTGTPGDSKLIDGKFYKFDAKGEINIADTEVKKEQQEKKVVATKNKKSKK